MNKPDHNTILPPAIFLMGPTASGKTDLALRLAQRLPCEIISVDSAQVYRGMDIGTAKPDAETLARFPHHLIDIRDAADTYSAADFCRDARRLMTDISLRQKIPLLVGGTMLYFRALQNGLAEMPASVPAVRDEIMAEATHLGWPAMHARLADIDPVTAARLHPNHSQRIARALEVYRISGKSLSALHSNPPETGLPFRVLSLALIPPDKKLLNRRIELRFQQMLDKGFLAEVEQLYARKDLSAELPSQKSVGYREAWLHLSGKLTREQMSERAIISTCQLAKRQLTWLRSWPDLQVIPVHSPVKGADTDVDKTAASAWQQVGNFLG